MSTIGEIKIDTHAFSKVIDKLDDRYRVPITKLIFQQHRFYTADLLKATPPETLKKGRVAIDKDLDKIFIPIDQQVVLDWYADNFGKRAKGVSKKVRSSVRGRLEGNGVIFNWNSDKARMRGFHESKRTGPQRGVSYKSQSVTVGKGLKFGTGMYANKNKVNAYKRERMKQVGKMKAGWVPAALHYGAKVPAFVARHAVKMGRYEDKVNENKVNIELTSVNSIPWTQKKIKGIMAFATRKRQKDLTIHLNNAVKRAAKEWSLAKNG